MRIRPQITFLLCGFLLLASTSWCEEPSLRGGGERSTDWTWPAYIIVPLVVMAALYVVGAVRMWRKAGHARTFLWSFACFAGGWMSLVLALDSPLHEVSEQLFWVHMTQHEILMLVSAPLIILGRPSAPLVWAVPASWRRGMAAVFRTQYVSTISRKMLRPASAWSLHAAALWLWHVPALFDAALRSDAVHAAQHASFLGTALLFWWALIHERGGALSYGGSIFYVFTTALHSSVLGALLTFSLRTWYKPYALTAPLWNLTPLEDQQLGGLIMWIPAGTILLLITVVLFAKWMAASDSSWRFSRTASAFRESAGAPPYAH